ncbi:hypothetical protein DdX_21827 [Ditylenchus destructor]|uniref:Uncharacterized protein n=1 Tax=Ditylenchus destructor TaxID=166010 RepID=A0AAD4MF74_9BILA|nr:hypothetical protein DdX_21827 [Ditylenchus destructor]
MKQIAIVIALCVGAWYFFIGGRKLDEPMVRDYYQKEAHAIYSRDPEALCKQLSRNARIESRTTMMGKTLESSHNRDEACQATRDTFQTFSKVGERMGASSPSNTSTTSTTSRWPPAARAPSSRAPAQQKEEKGGRHDRRQGCAAAATAVLAPAQQLLRLSVPDAAAAYGLLLSFCSLLFDAVFFLPQALALFVIEVGIMLAASRYGFKIIALGARGIRGLRRLRPRVERRMDLPALEALRHLAGAGIPDRLARLVCAHPGHGGAVRDVLHLPGGGGRAGAVGQLLPGDEPR